MRISTWGVVVLLLMSPIGIRQATQTAQSTGHPVARKLDENLYAYISNDDFNCNSVFLVGRHGILVVDTALDAEGGQKLLAAIRTVSPLPIQYVINTHYHRDHQGANGLVGPNAEVITTDWTRRRTLQFLSVDLPKMEEKATGAMAESLRSSSFRPATVTTQKATVYVGDVPVELYFPGPAHTQGDLLVYFPSQRVMATGDLFDKNASPSMDDGSVLNWIKALEQILSGPAETIVPGHFEVASKKDLQNFHDYLVDLRDQVKQMLAQGATLEQVRLGVQTQKYAGYRQYPNYRATFADNAEFIYHELLRAQQH